MDELNIQEIINERSRLLSSLTGEQRRRPARRRCIKVIFLVALLILLLTVAGVVLGVMLLQTEAAQSTPTCSSATYLFDCYPEGGANETSCRSRGCCWNSSASSSCFYPDGFGYAMNGALSEESYGHSATLSRKANQPVQYRGPATTLRVDVFLETQYRLRVKVYVRMLKYKYYSTIDYGIEITYTRVAATSNRWNYCYYFPLILTSKVVHSICTRYQTPVPIATRYHGPQGPSPTRPLTHSTKSELGRRHSTSL